MSWPRWKSALEQGTFDLCIQKTPLDKLRTFFDFRPHAVTMGHLMFSDLVRLFSNIPRAKVAKFFLLQIEVRATPHEVASQIGLTHTVAKREMAALSNAGLLIPRRQGASLVYAINTSHPYSSELKALLKIATSATDKEIAEFFKGVAGVQLIVAAGILAEEDRGVLDLLIVTRRTGDRRIHLAVKKLEKHLALPLRYAILESREFVERMEARDRLLRDIFEFSHRIVQGRL